MASDDSLVLVTGASGYIASYIVKQLQEEGWKVRGTVRSLENEEVTGFLKGLVPDAKHPLDLVQADLLQEDTWKAAAAGVTHVIHTASPFPDNVPKDPNTLIKPAVDGTLAVLRAATEAGTVKRVVLTSSIAAVFDSSVPLPKEKAESKTFNEEDWTDAENPGLDPYAKSKTLAEKAAWDYVKELPEDKKLDLVVINPGMVLGPVLSSKRYTASHLAIKALFDWTKPAIPKLKCNLTDVRDVAQAHVTALTSTEAIGKRHLIVNGSVWMKELAAILQKEFRPKGYAVTSLTAPNILVRVSSFVDKGAKMVASRLGREVKYDNERMREVLKITPTDLEKTAIDTANSFIEEGIIKKSKKSLKQEKAETNGTDAVTPALQNGGTTDEKEGKTNGEVGVNGELEPEDKDKPAAAVVDSPAAPVEVPAN